MARTGIPRIYTFTVSGCGPFPIDMLRHDRATPKTESDAGHIERSYQPRNREQHRITLIGSKAPTEPRWGSFGWAVESVE